MRRLSPIEVATIFMADLPKMDLLSVAAAALETIHDPYCAGALRDAAHRIARRADELERLLVGSSDGSLVEQCQPDNAMEPASGHFPQGAALVALGAFQEPPHET